MYIERISDKFFRKISNFECEEESMEEFLKSEAYKYDLEGEGNTYLFVDDNDIILGYYTLKCNSIQMFYEENKYNQNKVYPCVEIARIAIDTNYRNKGLGSILLSSVIKDIVSLSDNVGIKYIILFSIPSAEEFYTNKNMAGVNFIDFPKEINFLMDSKEDKCRPLFITIDDVKP